MPPPVASLSIDEHDRLVANRFRVAWRTAGLLPTQLPRKPWVTQDIWELLTAHAATRRCHCDTQWEESLEFNTFFVME